MFKYNRHRGIIAYPQLGGRRGFAIEYPINVPGQRGRGIGSFLKRAGRRFAPVLKNVGKQVLQSALPEAQGLVNDILSGKKLKTSFKTRGRNMARKALKVGKANAGSLLSAALQSGSGRRKTKPNRKANTKRQEGGNNSIYTNHTPLGIYGYTGMHDNVFL